MNITPFSNESDVRSILSAHLDDATLDDVIQSVKRQFDIEMTGPRKMRLGDEIYQLRPDVKLIRCLPVEMQGYYGSEHGATVSGWRVTDMYTANGGAQICIGLVDESIRPTAWVDL